MPRIIRPQQQVNPDRTQISPSAASSAGQGIVSVGQAIRETGRAQASIDVSAGQRRIGQAISAFGAKMFEESRLAAQTGVLSNSLADATLDFQKQQQQRLQQVTDQEGNPTYSSLVDDLGTIGNNVTSTYSQRIKDPVARQKFEERFRNFVTNQQVAGLSKARQQEISFGRNSLDRGLGALSNQAVGDPENLETYINDGSQLVDDALQSGLIGPEEHQRLKSDFVSMTRESAIANVIRADANAGSSIMEQSAEQLGLSQEQHTKLKAAAAQAVTSDEIAQIKAKEVQAIEEKADQAGLVEQLDTMIQADALRPDELLLQKDKLPQESFSQLRKKMVKRQAEAQKERTELKEVSNAISEGRSLDNISSGKVNKHFEFSVDTLTRKKGQPLTLVEKAQVAARYPGKVNLFAREISSSLFSGDANKAAEAVTAYTYLRDKGSRALEGNIFTNKAEMIASQAELISQNSGIPLPEAVTKVRDRMTNIDDVITKQRVSEFNKLSAFKANEIADTLAEEVDAENIIGINYEVDVEAQNTYRKLAQENYIVSQDEDEAKAAAASMMKTLYGVSEINGEKTFMKAPPEKIFNMDADVLRDQLVTDVSGTGLLPEGTDTESVRLVPDTSTRGSRINGQEAVTYLVEYTHPSGERVPLIDDNGQVLRWTPNTGAATAIRDLEGQQSILEARAKRDIQGQEVGRTPGLSLAIDDLAKAKVSGNVRDAIDEGAKIAGVDSSILASIAKAESALNPLAKNKNSSATGLFQFIDSTWNAMVEKYGAQYGISKGDRKDARANAIMGALFTRDNARALTAAGHEAGARELYLAHFSGVSKAKRVLKALKENPDAPVSTVYSAREISSNPRILRGTIAEAFKRLTDKVVR